MACSCNFFNEVAEGGIVCGGEATSEVIGISGGVICGGAALIDVVQDPYDNLIAIWPLDEVGAGVTDEYQDRSRNEYHGTGGDGNSLYVPDTTLGVFCLPCASFDGETREFITLPPDNLSTDHAFTVSAWLKVNTIFASRMVYSRGHDSEDAQWKFTFGYSYLNHLMASINQTVDGTADATEAYSNTTLAEDKFYHVACSFDGVTLQLYIDGEEVGEADSTGENIALENEGAFGSWNNGAFHTGTLQEVRLHPEVKSQAYLLAEHDNFCSGGFFIIGEEEYLGFGGLLASGEADSSVS